MNFDQAAQYVIAEEGGYSDDREDSGNWTSGIIGQGILKGTKYGISAASYPHLDIINLTRKDALAIYKIDYWGKMRCYELPESIRLHVFDFGVNAGITTAIKALQRAGGINADGVIGPNTLAAAGRVSVWEYAKARARHYVDTAKARPVKIKYLAGWMQRTLEITEISLKHHA